MSEWEHTGTSARSPAQPLIGRPVTTALAIAIGLGCLTVGLRGRQPDVEGQIIAWIERAESYAAVPASSFDALGWDLPDGGRTVKALADAAPGGAFDPRALERLSSSELGYAARWHEVRYGFHGLEWDVTGLALTPRQAVPGLPTVVLINGGSANWYEFFVTPLNEPAVGQYLAQRVPVLLVSIPGNFRHGGWTLPPAERRPAYLLDRDLPDEEVRLRNAIFTFGVVVEGVRQVVERASTGPVLIAGHSTGGEIQFLLRDVLRDRLNGYSLGWGTGGPASVRRSWEDEAAAARNRTDRETPSLELARVRPRTPKEYARGYIGPLNPLGPGTPLEIAERWFAREDRRRPQFKQPLQDVEHRGEHWQRPAVEKEIRALLATTRLPVNGEQVLADLFSTLRTPTDGYRRMIWTTAAGDDGHWDANPAKARELFVAEAFRKANPGAPIRVLVFDVPMSHYGHIERPRQLAGGLLAAVKWVYQPAIRKR
jgi:hypothetical protein